MDKISLLRLRERFKVEVEAELDYRWDCVISEEILMRTLGVFC